MATLTLLGSFAIMIKVWTVILYRLAVLNVFLYDLKIVTTDTFCSQMEQRSFMEEVGLEISLMELSVVVLLQSALYFSP